MPVMVMYLKDADAVECLTSAHDNSNVGIGAARISGGTQDSHCVICKGCHIGLNAL